MKVINERIGDLVGGVIDLPTKHNNLNFWEEYRHWRLGKQSILAHVWGEAKWQEYNERCLFSLIDHIGLYWQSFVQATIGELKRILSEKGEFQEVTPLLRVA